jgi:hypothetical protein
MPETVGYAKKNVSAKKWTEQVVRAKRLLAAGRAKRDTRHQVWRQADEYYKGNQWSNDASTAGDGVKGKLVVPYVFSTVTTIIPYITANAPSFRVEPYSRKATLQAGREQTAWLNKEWRSHRMDGNLHLRRAAFDSHLYGNGYLAVSYAMVTNLVEESAFADGTKVELYVDRVSPWDVWLDPAADGMFNSRWVIRRLRLSIAELKADPSYKNVGNIAASQRSDENDRDRDEIIPAVAGSEEDMLVEVYEFYDTVDEFLVVFVEQHEKPLRVVTDMALPIVDIAGHELPGSPYAMGDVEQIFVLQDEINVTRSQIMEHRKRNVSKWVVRKGGVEDEGQKALRSQETNAVVEIDSDEPIANIITHIAPTSPAADIYQNYIVAKEDVYEVTGLSEYVRGGTPSIRKTATEASIIEAATNIKTNHKLQNIERAARLVGQLLRDYAADLFPLTSAEEKSMVLTGREAAAVAQEPGVEQVEVTLSDEVWEGRFEVNVEVGSTALRNPAEREQKYKDLFLTLFPMSLELMQTGINLNYQKMLELWFEAAGVDDLDSMFQGNQAALGAVGPDGALGGGVPGLGGLDEGQPNFDGAGPPLGNLDELNTGALPPLTAQG